MVIQDEIELKVTGIQTVGTLRNAIRRYLKNDNWDVNWGKWRDTKGQRVNIVQEEPLLRVFKIPVVLIIKDYI